MKTVSIIIPVYNAEKDLERCINSILFQTYNEWELWLIDDGSKDRSSLMCDKFCERDSRINVIHKENGGVSSARNRGLKEAEGDYIFFVDSDDYLESDALEKMVYAIEKENADIVFCGFHYRVVADNSHCVNLPERSFAGDNTEFVKECFVDLFQKDLINPPWNKLFKRAVVKNNKISFNENISILEDISFSVQLLNVCDKVVVLQEALYNYVFKLEGNLVHKFHDNFFDALKFFDGCLYEYLKKYSNKDLDKVRQEFFFKRTLAYLRKVYDNSSFDSKRKYEEVFKVCNDERMGQCTEQLEVKDIKKKVVKYCIKYKKHRLLHLLYLMT